MIERAPMPQHLDDPRSAVIFLSRDNQLLVEINRASDLPFEAGIPNDAIIGLVEFLAKNGSRTYRMFSAFAGIQEFFEKLEQHQLVRPDYLLAHTNNQMSRMARRLGFERTDLTPMIEDDNRKLFSIVGSTDCVQRKLAMLASRTDTRGRSIPEAIKQRIR